MIDLKTAIDFRKIIEFYSNSFIHELCIIPVIGGEIEFYTKKKTSIKKLKDIIQHDNVTVVEEEGKNQFELHILPTTNAINFIEILESVKKSLKDLALFDTKPFDKEPTSSLHIHINFLNQNGYNLFQRKEGKNPKILAHSLGGLLSFMKESCVFFAPTQNCYIRYNTVSMTTPSSVSWGINNRTTAIRITPRERGARRIEHRLSSANADLEKVISAILASIYVGIKEKIIPQEPIYGNAFDEQYTAEKLPQNLEEAQVLFMQGRFYNLLTGMKEEI